MHSANQAHLPITESDAEVAELVQGMSPLVLALSAVHMSGSLDILRCGVPPAFNGDTGGSLSDADAARLLSGQGGSALSQFLHDVRPRHQPRLQRQ